MARKGKCMRMVKMRWMEMQKRKRKTMVGGAREVIRNSRNRLGISRYQRVMHSGKGLLSEDHPVARMLEGQQAPLSKLQHPQLKIG
jgi:hypothetical protein